MNQEEKKDLTSKIEVLIKNSIVFIHDDIDEQKFIVDPDGIDVIINTVVEALKKDDKEVESISIAEHSKYVNDKFIGSSARNRSVFNSGWTNGFKQGFGAALKFDEE